MVLAGVVTQDSFARAY